MSQRVVINVLRALLLVAAVMILLMQTVLLPWLSGEMARDLPAEAHMRWPMLSLAVLGLLCVQAVLVCTIRLLSFVRDGQVFSPSALGWVDGIIAAFAAAGLVCLATLIYQSMTIAGPLLWMLALLGGVLAGSGLALLVWVMRAMLVQATKLRTEMEMVI
ncbi:hypothetical protein AVL62_16215 [Serinicoccus chungangensis]|uniref:ABC transporter n=1 Tax=Serinicoccus chungangensis TaxID=767452 RepID=A0A0W8I991_9MICO|nr:DUF2975 domain-containing protein [Serinicoccus chungangensis]KUG56331.1 hypothetical protein AVL62_16215 [Serinicoccus chungangensis]